MAWINQNVRKPGLTNVYALINDDDWPTTTTTTTKMDSNEGLPLVAVKKPGMSAAGFARTTSCVSNPQVKYCSQKA